MPVGVAAVIVLAAGGGTRMKSAKSKLLHQLGGRSLLSWALDAAVTVQPERLVVVVGQMREQVEAHLDDIAPTAIRALQDVPHGTGHAVQVGLEALGEATGEIVVTYGDVPMLSGRALADLISAHREDGNSVTVLTAVVDDPSGYGRIVRDGEAVAQIVEDRDATPEQRQLREINAGIYVFDAALLRDGLAQLRADNAQGELYLTDLVGYARSLGQRVGAQIEADVWQTMGVNDRVQLAALNHEMNRRVLREWMLAGVTVIDPATTWVDRSVSLAPDVEIWPDTVLRGATTVAEGAIIGPGTRLTDVEVGANAQVLRSEATLAVIGPGAVVGPFSYLRPGTELGAAGKIGAFCETKNARLGAGTKVPHLTYCGDAVVGDGTNIGAGVIFANYDGVHKHQTTVGAHSFVGSDSVLVAPAEVGDGAYVAAGSVVTTPVPPGDLAVGRARQRNLPGWVARQRPATKSAAAAVAADSRGPDDGPSTAAAAENWNLDDGSPVPCPTDPAAPNPDGGSPAPDSTDPAAPDPGPDPGPPAASSTDPQE
ncbi:MAG: bifunctional UDP-N-acetylglucosamine diphosphorylase/glucosamine-1-phosphate N-acetyltransferase GlmU [Propionibacteriaceae bacterium]|jgi:bifunctional UDP-N-acetylglucosamine pyrophosphorylase/glucosamine-1-phosphate N-acetyltransferase|nr:bifunctional UDP-N-acetylglucosamine diphosphorylase/glucosamine-1-phosphate N-acetyltransferase GlmU [Propionibacteriaceae bacterium]